ncbi:MAG: Peptidyl-tRNA hydrolase [Eubacteriales bacterium SKADARSKE-1]|nr:Peptidyl-tRNA hydrolase [Eubacteriales bacterium SKADARSKE-1]
MFDIFKKITTHKIEKSGKIEFLIIGLGNPGKKYENTRHNAGFMAADYIANKCNSEINKIKFKALFCDAVIENKRVLLIKPQTFMNLSGEAVTQFMSFYKIPSEKVIIIFDDISLSLGLLRIRQKGSAGGHNGIKNIIELTGTDNFPRIKLGIGKKPAGWDLANWVTSQMPTEDLKKLQSAIENSYEALKLMVNDKTSEAMNKFNS